MLNFTSKMKGKPSPTFLQKGFTLLEILIVLVIMAIIAGAASIAIVGADRTAKVKNFAEELANLLPVVEQQAILQPAQIGLVIANQSYQFYHYVPSEDDPSQGDWKLLQDAMVFKTRTYSSDIVIQIETPADNTEVLPVEDQTIQPQILFYSSGDMTPFTMTLGLKNKPPLYQIIGLANGEITVHRINALSAATKPGAKP